MNRERNMTNQWGRLAHYVSNAPIYSALSGDVSDGLPGVSIEEQFAICELEFCEDPNWEGGNE